MSKKSIVKIVAMLIVFVSLFWCEDSILSTRIVDTYAEEFKEWSYRVLEDNTIEITKYNGKRKKVDIPSKINGKKVTSIGYGAFWKCSNITSVTVPKGVTNISESAFELCSKLRKIELPKGVTNIGSGAFLACAKLEEINIPKEVTTIGESAFNGCSSLKSITIPESVTTIGNRAFNGCNSLERIVVSKKNKVYDSRNNCNAIIRKTDKVLIVGCNNSCIPKGIRKIEADAFAGYSGLKKIVIPESVTSIGDNAFANCTGLANITIPKKVTNIGNAIFAGCNNLKSIVVHKSNKKYDSRNKCNAIIRKSDRALVAGCQLTTIPKGVRIIAYGAFLECSSLKNLTIPKSVRTIEDLAFNGCSNLKSITIPENVSSIGNLVFANCSNLKRIMVDKSNKIYDSRNDCNAIIKKSDSTLIVGCYKTTIPKSVKYIGNSAFDGCTKLKSITIPKGVIGIGGAVFYGCMNLKKVVVSKSVTDIAYGAFDIAGGIEMITPSKGGYSSDYNNLTIVCKPNSQALIYAIGNYINYKIN